MTPKKYFTVHNGLYQDSVSDAMWRKLSYCFRKDMPEEIFDQLWDTLPCELSRHLVVNLMWQTQAEDFYDE